MKIDDSTRLVDIDSDEEILEALAILGGAALMRGNRRLYEHLMSAKVQYEAGVDLNLMPAVECSVAGA